MLHGVHQCPGMCTSTGGVHRVRRLAQAVLPTRASWFCMTATTPLHMTGHFAPVPDEIDAVDLPVEGVLPPELTGRYLRNGPNPLPGEASAHWFTGHGMVHGIRLREGRAEWYRNRWVRTKALAGQPMIGPTARRPVRRRREHPRHRARRADPGAGREQLPARADARAGHRRALRLRRPAHHRDDRPPQDRPGHRGAALLRLRRSLPPFLTYHRLSAAGELVTSAEIAVPGPTMMHDFAITDRHAVFLDLPMTFSLRAPRHRHALRLGRLLRRPDRGDAAGPARRGALVRRRPGATSSTSATPTPTPRAGSSSTPPATPPPTPWRCGTAWATTPPGTPRPRPPPAPPGCTAGCSTRRPARSRRRRWRTGRRVPDRGRRARRPRRPLPVRGGRHRRLRRHRQVRRRDGRGRRARPRRGHGRRRGRVRADAAAGRAEDDGWLLTITTRRDGSASQLLVLDATDVAGRPVAAVTLPRGVPSGFHGSWIPDEPTSGR